MAVEPRAQATGESRPGGLSQQRRPFVANERIITEKRLSYSLSPAHSWEAALSREKKIAPKTCLVLIFLEEMSRYIYVAGSCSTMEVFDEQYTASINHESRRSTSICAALLTAPTDKHPSARND